jgi:hypothetical protein
MLGNHVTIVVQALELRRQPLLLIKLMETLNVNAQRMLA